MRDSSFIRIIRRMKTYILIPFFLLFLLSCSKSIPEKPYSHIVTSSQFAVSVQAHCDALIQPSTRGLYPGSPYYTSATAYITSKFQSYGLLPAHTEYAQPFEFVSRSLISEPVVMINNEDLLTIGTDFIVPLTSGKALLENIPMVFIGYGIAEPQDKYNEYSNIDVKNKVVVVLKDIPKGFIASSGKYHSLYYRAFLAKNYGALGIIFIDLNAPTAYYSKNTAYVPPLFGLSDFPQIILAKNAIGKLTQSSTIDFIEMQNDIVASKQPYTIELKTSITMSIPMNIEQNTTANIVGFLPAAEEFSETKKRIYFTASLDSFGFQYTDIFYESANTTVSGVAALLSLAEELSKQSLARKNDIYFVVFSGKEEGLLGCRELLEKGEITQDNTLFMIQIENIGIQSSLLNIGGGLDYLELFQRFEENNTFSELELTVSHGGYMEDQLFIKKGIPALFVHSPDFTFYRTLKDTRNTINTNSVRKTVQLLYGAFFNDIFSIN